MEEKEGKSSLGYMVSRDLPLNSVNNVILLQM